MNEGPRPESAPILHPHRAWSQEDGLLVYTPCWPAGPLYELAKATGPGGGLLWRGLPGGVYLEGFSGHPFALKVRAAKTRVMPSRSKMCRRPALGL